MSRERRWLELRVRGPSDGEDDTLLAEGLLVLGGRAVEERWGWYLTHLEEPDELGSFLRRARRSLEEHTGLRGIEIEVRWQDHQDWAERWKRGLGTRHLTDRLVVTPSWIPYQAAEGERVVVLDPGMAFGTAEHGTTRGCLRLLDGVVHDGDRVVDVGAGSGILAIAAALLGAGRVVAVEGDQLACEAMRENLARNGVTGRVEPVAAWADEELLARYPRWDGVVANIEWHKLAPLVPGLVGVVRPGGWLVLSGILEGEVDEVEERASGLGVHLRATDADGVWRSLLLERSGEG